MTLTLAIYALLTPFINLIITFSGITILNSILSYNTVSTLSNFIIIMTFLRLYLFYVNFTIAINIIVANLIIFNGTLTIFLFILLTKFIISFHLLF